MSESDPCARTIVWSGETYILNLSHKWVRRVLGYRGINGRPPAAVLLGFETGAYTVDDVERILELGLIGSGMDERDADKLLDQHVRGKPIAANAVIAFEVLAALFVGKVQTNVDASA
ncbi:gene transfer agent family protein [Bradyrhizobium sp. Leo170]|uniref:gene transfer agent family protein n=1 Tax=Bradyrhizobium sp. Leo170 TaxID=1571199 RepID=UPI00102E4B3B|nr:gene transfer agent family protein [Bradyrhizobium sp. Leo170]TAI63460.1 hypothetical protein CWO89_24130 [Bradyrhizobium sp. Leo170]